MFRPHRHIRNGIDILQLKCLFSLSQAALKKFHLRLVLAVVRNHLALEEQAGIMDTMQSQGSRADLQQVATLKSAIKPGHGHVVRGSRSIREKGLPHLGEFCAWL